MSDAKRVENRPRRTLHRGPLLIHAGVRRSYAGQSADAWAALFGVDSARLVYGAIVGVVDVVDCVRVESMPLRVPDLAGTVHAFGHWCWILARPRRLPEPIPFSGKLGLFVPDVFTLCRVREALASTEQAEVLSC